MQLEITKLAQTYQGVSVFQDISLSLGPGDHLALLGPSGCGKSTLFRILTGLELPSTGEVRLNGQSIIGETGHFGFMNQKDLLLPWKKLWENVGIPLRLRGWKKAAIKEQVSQALKQVGLDGFAEYYPWQLSGGMRQRAAFLRTWLANKELLLLDEPFAALDALTRNRLQQWLAELLTQEQATLFLVTHSVDEALLLAGRVLVMSPAPGRILLDLDLEFSALPFEQKPLHPGFAQARQKILASLGTWSEAVVSALGDTAADE